MFSKANRKSQYFELDAIIAITLLVIGFIYIRSISFSAPLRVEAREYGEEAVSILRSLIVDELNESLVEGLEQSELGFYTHRDFSVAKQASIYASMGDIELAANITRVVIDDIIPSLYGYGVWFVNSSALTNPEDEILIFNRTWPEPDDNIGVGKTLITSYFEDKKDRDKGAFSIAMLEVRVWQ